MRVLAVSPTRNALLWQLNKISPLEMLREVVVKGCMLAMEVVFLILLGASKSLFDSLRHQY